MLRVEARLDMVMGKPSRLAFGVAILSLSLKARYSSAHFSPTRNARASNQTPLNSTNPDALK